MKMRKGSASVRRGHKRPTPEALKTNAILAELEEPDAALVVRAGSVIELGVRDQIYEPDIRIDHVYFPLDCVLSIVTRMKDGNQIEIGTIGREGMSAIPLLLGAKTTANECYCQVPGSAVRIEGALFESLLAIPKFRQLLDRYVQAYVNMLGQLAACNRLHHVYERCARWLLMTHDRVGLKEIELTHEYLAMMLGTQRSGVTIAAATLQHAGLIRYNRGTITILDRPGLEGASCECYEVAREQFGELLRPVNGNRKTPVRREPSRDGQPSRRNRRRP